jgi:DnaK suppressor protein
MDEPIDEAPARERLGLLLAELEADLALARESAGTVELDQRAVGRLSRMDALQQQAMAHASVQRLTVQKRRLVAALDRVAAGTYGRCCDCGGVVEVARLERDATALFCLECLEEREA